MPKPPDDTRSPHRRAEDERLAAEAAKAPLDLSPGASPKPLEAHLPSRARRPLALAGVVENGLVRPLDTSVKLAEHSRVIIVATEGA